MYSIHLIVKFAESENSYALQFNNDISVADLCCEIRAKIPEAKFTNPSAYGIFVPDPDPRQSFWLDNSRMLSYYHFRDKFEVEYRCKLRMLVVQTMDDTKKKLQVDDSRTVSELMDTICARLGITNHEEYSLLRPLDEEERMRTLTLRKAKSSARDQDKLEKLKQKLQTDDDLNWLGHGHTLRQQGVEESDVLLLRRKYFFSDQNVDARDPVQLNLLYIQLKEAILNGKHPISLEQAINLAVLQCQAELGLLTPEKAKHSSNSFKDNLPKEYCKVKGVEKRILDAYKNLGDFDQREAKLRYVQLCRSLPTYGIAFFLIKEKLKGKNKLVPRLFGISKDSVMRVDEKTKDILETWPLTRIRRWAAGVNLFTLDFGQYNPDANYAMQTTEGEQIGQLISGYIDIILRRQRNMQSALANGDEENTIVEENVGPSRANVISSVSGTFPRATPIDEANVALGGGKLVPGGHSGDYAEGNLATRGHVVVEQAQIGAQAGSRRFVSRDGPHDGADSSNQNFQLIDLGQPKRALIARINFGLRTIQEATEELEAPIYSDDEALRGDDVTTKRWRNEALEQARSGVWSHLGAMTMATGELVACLPTTPNDPSNEVSFDYSNMDASLASIGMNVHGLMQCVRLFDQVDAAGGGGGEIGMRLKAAAQSLSDACVNLMRSTEPVEGSELDRRSSLTHSANSLVEPNRTCPDRVALLEAASHVGDASRQLLQLISQPTVQSMNARVESSSLADEQLPLESSYQSVIDWEARDQLLSATKSVAKQMALLVKTAKTGAMNLGQEAMDLNARDGPADSLALLRNTQSHLVQTATAAGKSASRLVTCAKVAVCTMEQPASQELLIRTAKQVGVSASAVSETVEELTRNSMEVADDDAQLHEAHLHLDDQLNEDVLGVHSELDSLIECLRSTSIQAHQDSVVGTILSVSSQLPTSVGNGVNVVNKATSLAMACSHLLDELRAEARDAAANHHNVTGLSSTEANHRAQVLESAIHHLVTVAQECATGNVQSLEHQQTVVVAAQQLITTAHSTSAPFIRARLTQGLEFATRLTASNVGPLVTVGGEVIRICPANSRELAVNLEKLQKRIMPQVNSSCTNARIEPYNQQKQINLLSASHTLMLSLEELLSITDAIVPTISDSGIQSAFSGAARNTQSCLTDLRLCYGNSEQVLRSEPSPFDQHPTDSATDSSDRYLAKDNQLWVGFMAKTNQKLGLIGDELRSNTTRLLPDESLDSVCVGLWSAVDQYNRAFPSVETAEADTVGAAESNLPALVTRILRTSSGDQRDWMQTNAITDLLLERLDPVVQGIRGLVASLTTATNAQSLDPDLARTLMLSNGLSGTRQSTLSGCSSPDDRISVLSNQSMQNYEEQARSTAKTMLEHLLSLGESCLNDSRQIIKWAWQQTPLKANSEDTNQIAMIAEQLITSVNAVLGYVPGEVIIRRLLALLDDTNRKIRESSHTGGTSSPDYAQPPNSEPYSKLAHSARRLAKICFDASSQVTECSKLSDVSSTANEDKLQQYFGHDSILVRLARVGDRISNGLAEVVRDADSSNENQSLHGLMRVGHPVACGLRQAMRTLDTSSANSSTATAATSDHRRTPSKFSTAQALLALREWATELALEADGKAVSLTSPYSDGQEDNSLTEPSQTADAEDVETVRQMRCQGNVAIQRINSLLQPTDSASSDLDSNLCPVRLPATYQTYPQCLDSLNKINGELKTNIDVIQTAAVKHDAGTFIDAVQLVAQTTSHLLRVANQAAYLVGAAHPASKPGQTGRLSASDQLTALHDHIAAIRKGSSEINQATLGPTPDNLPPLEIINTTTNVAQRAAQLCQTTRPLLSVCRRATEKKLLAESLEVVARRTAALFRSTAVSPSEDRSVVFERMKTVAAQLEEAVDQYTEVLFRSACGSPTVLADEAFALQTPILRSTQTVVEANSRLLETSLLFLTPNQTELSDVTDQFQEKRDSLFESMHELTDTIHCLTPGVDSCQAVQDTVQNLLAELNNATMTITTGTVRMANGSMSSRIETSLGLVRSSAQHLEQYGLDSVENWRLGHWELLSHSVRTTGVYLPSLVKECVQSAMGLTRVSEQTGLLNLTSTVLEAVQQLFGTFQLELKRPEVTSPSDENSTLSDYSQQLQQACRELLLRVNTMAKLQGGLSWHQASIAAACSKLDDACLDPSTNQKHQNGTGLEQDQTLSLPGNFVQLHTRLGHQLRALKYAAVHLTQVNDADMIEAISALSQQFVHMTDTVRAIASILVQQTQADQGSELAGRFYQLTQAVGDACSDLLRAPQQTEPFNLLSGKLDELKAVLQSCAHGADACATAASSVGRLAADLDTAALFARAGSFAASHGDLTVLPSSPTSPFAWSVKHKAFQNAKEAVMQATKGIVEEMPSLIKNASTNQDALAVSAQNCLLRTTELSESVRSLVSCSASLSPNPKFTTEEIVENQVQLLTCTRDVTTVLVQLLHQAKSVAATCYAIEAWGDQPEEQKLLVEHQKAVNDTTLLVVERISGLSGSLKVLNESFDSTKPSVPTVSSPAPAVSPKPNRLSGILRSVSNVVKGEETSGKTSVHVGLRSVIDVLTRFEKSLPSWTIDHGDLQCPASSYDYASEEQSALGQYTKPSELASAGQSISKAAATANSAATSGKLSEIAMAGDLLRRSTEELVRTLSSACRSALHHARQTNGAYNVEHGTTDDEAHDHMLSMSRVEACCRRAIAGTLSTVSELRQLVEYMHRSLDTGPSSPECVQVTLAMRRLRETVYEIVQSSLDMPGAKGENIDPHLPCTKKIGPSVPPKPVSVVMRAREMYGQTQPQSYPKPTKRTSSLLLTNPKHQTEVEQSIADANATAPDQTSLPLQKELCDMAGELERNVHQIGQLHSRRGLGHQRSVRFSPSTVCVEAAEPTEQPVISKKDMDIPVPGPNSDLDRVVTACQEVIHRTLGLMHWAAAAQRELVQQGRLKPVELELNNGSDASSQWAEGLISAARYVATATKYVVDAARSIVTERIKGNSGNTTELNSTKPETLISAAQTTAGHTAQLVVACVAKADPLSKSCIGLRKAGAGVRQATDDLVRLVEALNASSTSADACNNAQDNSLEGINIDMVSSMRRVIETKSNIAAKQRELEALQTQLKHIHQDHYKPHPT